MDIDVSEKVFAVVASFDAYFNYVKLMRGRFLIVRNLHRFVKPSTI